MSPEQTLARREARLKRYSQKVRWMKIALPIGALVLIGLIFLVGKDRGAVIDLEDASNAALLGAGLKLENPRFAGTTDDGDPFVVTARSALPDGAMPDRIDLEQPAGEVRLGDGMTVKVNATDGQMFRKDEKLNLTGDVTLTTSNGYEAATDRVEMDLAAKTAIAPGPIEANGPRGSIRADRLKVQRTDLERGDVTIRFEGNVRVIYRSKTD